MITRELFITSWRGKGETVSRTVSKVRDSIIKDSFIGNKYLLPLVIR